ncbi:MAG: ABC transporter substrate-binding protein [Chloroflexi bacterium]|jgi:NitT/TauT family transport system substrate-binding protein|nr:ABC transporter substrate-binding protein [Chloroflexota bacterium]
MRPIYAPLVGLLAVLLALAACAPAAPTATTRTEPAAGAPAAGQTAVASSATATRAAEPVTVRFGDIPSTSLAAVYIARERGYFREEGIEVHLEPFDTAESMIPALATDQLDVTGGGVNAGMFSAIARGLPIKIVAGISRNVPGMSSSALVVRKELIDSGRVRDYADLRGLRIALVSKTSGLGAEFYRVLDLGGLTEQDVDFKQLSFPDATIALTNGAIDAGILTEPFVARLVQSGAGVRWKGADEIYPEHQITALLYGPGFRERYPEAAVGFIKAYIRGAREYNAIMNSDDRTPVYRILTEYTPIKDLSIYPVMHPSGIHPDAALNVQSLEADQDLWARLGYIPQKADLQTAIDLQYWQEALRRLDGQR